MVCDHVSDVPSFQLAKSDYPAFDRVNASRNNGLNLQDQAGKCHYRVFGLLRKNGVPALAFNLNIDLAGSGKQGSFPATNGTCRQIGLVVEAIELVNLKVSGKKVLSYMPSSRRFRFLQLAGKRRPGCL